MSCTPAELRLALVAAGLWLAAAAASAELRATRLELGAPLSSPVFLTAPPGDPRLFVLERAGRIRVVSEGSLLPDPFLDLTAVVDSGPPPGEGGLLGLAFPTDYASSGLFYVTYTFDLPGTDQLESRVSRFRVSDADPDAADPGSELVLFSILQPQRNHNGGTVAIRGDFLYLALGDGGGGGDPLDAAQDDSTLLGKLLRFDLRIEPPIAPEVRGKGLRNPFRFSFDRLTGDLYIADVGQGAREEVNVEPSDQATPRNYGWDVLEGTACFDPDPGEPACDDPSLVDPVHEYAHTAGRCSITGGVVHRGGIPEIAGHYLFGDFCTGEIWSLQWDGAGGVVGGVVDRTAELAPDQGSIDDIVAFGEDADGTVYVVDLDGEIFQVPEPGAVWLQAVAGLVVWALHLGRRRPLG